jgi:hypothetical protein
LSGFRFHRNENNNQNMRFIELLIQNLGEKLKNESFYIWLVIFWYFLNLFSSFKETFFQLDSVFLNLDTI